MSTSPRSRLATLRGQDLRALHANGSVPSLDELNGSIDGAVLNGRLGQPHIRDLRLWRGKLFEQDEHGAVTGLNRLGLGPLRWDSECPSKDDNDNNPGYVRQFHDELVAIDEGLCLATSHYQDGDRLRYLCHFALAKAAAR